METNDETGHWYTIAEACKYLRVSKATLYANMADGRLPFYTMKGTRNRRLRKSDLDALLEPGNLSALSEYEEDDA
jgi:excisionase family DNA binding protein